LLRRSTAVAIRAAYVAFLDLGGYCLPAVGLVHEPVDGLALVRGIDVIKIEHERVKLTAINARMG
jgi:hypothetical protein